MAAFSIQVDSDENQLEVICEVGDGKYKKHFIGLNDWTIYVVEDVGGKVSVKVENHCYLVYNRKKNN